MYNVAFIFQTSQQIACGLFAVEQVKQRGGWRINVGV